jgi:hypothetical protein
MFTKIVEPLGATAIAAAIANVMAKRPAIKPLIPVQVFS